MPGTIYAPRNATYHYAGTRRRTVTASAASDKQVALITRLLGEKDLTGTIYAGHTVCPDGLTGGMQGSASATITALFALPRKREQGEAAPAQPGYYVRDGEVFVVVENKAKTSTYAKRLVITSTVDGKRKGAWEYAPGVGRSLAAEGLAPLTVEEAARLGHLHGVCMICGKPLTTPKSVQQGIGPVCIKRLRG